MSDENDALTAFRNRLHTAGLDSKNSRMRESSRHSDAPRSSMPFQQSPVADPEADADADADADVETAADAESEADEEETIQIPRRRSSRHLRSVDSYLVDDMKEQVRTLKIQNDALA